MLIYVVDNTGFIEIRVAGSKGNLELSPDNYDIREIISILENAEDLLYPVDKKDRPVISYNIEQGSVRHIFKTSLQYIIGFNAIIGQVSQAKSIDFLDLPTAKAFENIQRIAKSKDYLFSIETSVNHSNKVEITRNTSYYRKESLWVDAEFYFYGRINNAGGKDKANIHINTNEYGNLLIQTSVAFLAAREENILYKTLGIRAIGKQHTETGEIDTASLKFIEFVDYQPAYDEDYLNQLIEKASSSWSKIENKESWLKEIRGSYE